MFKVGDKVSITRGKLRGQSATVVAVGNDDQYSVRTDAGHLAVVNAKSLRDPGHPTIRVSAVLDAVEAVETKHPDASQALDYLLDLLDIRETVENDTTDAPPTAA